MITGSLFAAPSEADADMKAVDALARGIVVPDDGPPAINYVRKVLGGTEPAAKWGEALAAGYQVLPDSIIRHWGRRGLTPNDLAVLLNLTMAWWSHDERPYPRASTIARRVNVTVRTVQRSLQRLRIAKLVTSQKVVIRGETRRVFDLSGIAAQAVIWAKEDLELQASSSSRPRPNTGDGVQTRVSVS